MLFFVHQNVKKPGDHLPKTIQNERSSRLEANL